MSDPIRVFLLEDRDQQRLLRTLALENRGFVVVAPESFTEAVRLARDPAQHFDVAVLDVRMDDFSDADGRNGLFVGRLLRQRSGRPIPILILSGYPEARAYDGALSLNAGKFLSKHDIDVREFVRAVRACAVDARLAPPGPCAADEALEHAAMARVARVHLAPALPLIGCPFLLVLLDGAGNPDICGGPLVLPATAPSDWQELAAGAEASVPEEPRDVVELDDLPAGWTERLPTGTRSIGVMVVERRNDSRLILVLAGPSSRSEPLAESPDGLVRTFRDRRLWTDRVRRLVDEEVARTHLREQTRNAAALAVGTASRLDGVWCRDGRDRSIDLDLVANVRDELVAAGRTLQEHLDEPYGDGTTDAASALRDLHDRGRVRGAPQPTIHGQAELAVGRKAFERMARPLLQWATDRGGDAPVVVHLSTDRREATLRIALPGPPLPAAVRELVWAPFSQSVRAAPSEGGTRSHLALWIANATATAVHGSLHLEPSDDTRLGGMITLRLPRATAP